VQPLGWAFFLDSVAFLGSQGISLSEWTIIQLVWEVIGTRGTDMSSIEMPAEAANIL
jgi:hypothetical protein